MVETIIKTIIFDLDNTLHDAEFLTNRVVKKTIEVMITKGMNCNLEEGIEKFNQLLEKEPNNDKIRKLAAFFESEDEEIVNAG